MYSRLLIPLDGSKIAEQVLPYGRFFARALRIPVELLGIVDPVPLADFADVWERSNFDRLLAEETKATTQYLEATKRSFEPAQVGFSVEKGTPADVIVEKAATDETTLVMMVTHGRSGFRRWLLGSVAEKVVRGSDIDLFLVRAGEGRSAEGEPILKTVLVPLDGSDMAEKALSCAADLAKHMQLELLLLRAFALPSTLFNGESGSFSDRLMTQIKGEVQNYLTEKVNQMTAAGFEKVSSIANPGYGAEEIIAVARATPGNFIVISTHGRSGFRRWLLGSVAEKVVGHSGDPVLIVRAS